MKTLLWFVFASPLLAALLGVQGGPLPDAPIPVPSSTSFARSAGVFCTTKPSSIPACMPSFLTTQLTVSKSGGSFICTAMPVPGGPAKPCVVLASTTGLLTTPLQSSFGWMCMDQPRMLGAWPAFAGGTSGSCSGTYTFQLQAMVAGAAWITAGSTLYVQAWYRDDGFAPPDNANYTNGIGPIPVTP